MWGQDTSTPIGALLLSMTLALLPLGGAWGCSRDGPTSSSSSSGSASTPTAGAASAAEADDAPQAFAACPDDLDALVGRHITLVGTQTRSKIPTVCGVDVAGDDELSDETVEATGRLERHVIEPRPKDAPVVASRGPGTYYSLVDPDTGRLARTRPH